MNKIIDSHTHLIKSFYKDKFDDVLKKTLDELFLIVNIGFNKKAMNEVLELSEKYNSIYSAIGFHPLDEKEYNEDSKNFLEENLKRKKVLALGEIGLDYHYPPFDKERQKFVFKEQIELAKKLSLPIIIHARDSIDDVYEIIKDYPNQKFLLHSWGIKLEDSKKFLDLKNTWYGFNGVITFSSTKYLTEILQKIPLNRIMFETDSPFLTPVPFRGKKNSPYNVKLVYEYFSKIRNIKEEELEKIVLDNFSVFFNIKL
ncbi:MAG: hydrolase TatD [Candidatus Hepatoplasma vulgare]|nr:MAG: hydrolase TatD [Candidatus Hepatoplasma sp.]